MRSQEKKDGMEGELQPVHNYWSEASGLLQALTVLDGTRAHTHRRTHAHSGKCEFISALQALRQSAQICHAGSHMRLSCLSVCSPAPDDDLLLPIFWVHITEIMHAPKHLHVVTHSVCKSLGQIDIFKPIQKYNERIRLNTITSCLVECIFLTVQKGC